MPKYDYSCKNCERVFEFQKSIADPHPEKCEECGGELARVFSSGVGIAFKGSGFYKTDNRSK